MFCNEDHQRSNIYQSNLKKTIKSQFQANFGLFSDSFGKLSMNFRSISGHFWAKSTIFRIIPNCWGHLGEFWVNFWSPYGKFWANARSFWTSFELISNWFCRFLLLRLKIQWNLNWKDLLVFISFKMVLHNVIQIGTKWLIPFLIMLYS